VEGCFHLLCYHHAVDRLAEDQTDGRHLRRDAEQNRCQIVSAARELFAERGIDVPLEDIARHAGVGIATLYRRFPTRQALIEEIFDARLEQAVQAAVDALAEADAWEGFTAYIMRLCELQAHDSGLRDVLMTTFPTARTLEATRIKGHRLAKQLIERAKEQGRLREDFSAEDLIFLLLANGAFVSATNGIRRTAWKRYVALFLQGCRAEGAHELPEPPLSERQMFQAMLAIRSEQGSRPT
jgi:AcrR family transcriptional regulator